MAKKKLYSLQSMDKLAYAILGNVAGRLGGLATLDRDVQLKLLDFSYNKANYWNNKFNPYHALNQAVVDELKASKVDPLYWGIAMGLARGIAKCYATLPEDKARECSTKFETRLENLGLPEGVAYSIESKAYQVGVSMRGLYHLAPTPEETV